MKINKQHELWVNNAPWHVKASAWGSSTYEAVNNFATICSFLAFAGFFISAILLAFQQYVLAGFFSLLLIFGLSAHMYSLAQIWLLSNREVLSENDVEQEH